MSDEAATEPVSPVSLPLRVLLVEDDELLSQHVLLPRLRQLGFEVEATAQGAGLEARLAQRPVDIVVLDVGLPDRDGFEAARQLRSRAAELGIVMLTARGKVRDRVRGLSEGADAYLSKPVDIDVLAATLYSLGRRLRATAARTGGAGWRLDAGGWCLLSPAGKTVALTRTESRILAMLMERPNQVVPREALIEALAANVYDFDPHRLESLVHRLRKKVGKVLGETLPLNTVHREGYVLLSSA